VNGTGVNGSGMLTCAAIAVSTATNATAPICSAIRNRASARVMIAPKSVEYMNADLSVCVLR
jgi:hypothetical protein